MFRTILRAALSSLEHVRVTVFFESWKGFPLNPNVRIVLAYSPNSTKTNDNTIMIKSNNNDMMTMMFVSQDTQDLQTFFSYEGVFPCHLFICDTALHHGHSK